MEKSPNVDIKNLFREFAGEPESYHEIKQKHAEEKALQNWPIVNAMKNEMKAAPKLRTPALDAAPSAAGRRVSGASPSVVQRNAVGQHSAAVDLIGGMRATPAPSIQSAGSLGALFSALEAPRHSPPTNFQTQAEQSPHQVLSIQAGRSQKKDSLNETFARLLGTPQSETVCSPQNSLRSMLERLKKQ